MIAVSVAFAFYELQAVYSQAHKCGGVWTPIHTKSQAASFRKVNILQSIVCSYFAVSHGIFFPLLYGVL